MFKFRIFAEIAFLYHKSTDMLPIIAIVGRPNVGKSTLFNALTKTRAALVADFPGVTRDRQYGRGVVGDRPYWVIDTGGIGEGDTSALAQAMQSQTLQALSEADVVLFLVDAKDGLMPADRELAQQLRRLQHSTLQLVVNKVDREDSALINSEFYELGLGEPQPISATQGRGVKSLMHQILTQLPEVVEEVEADTVPHVAVIGRPNVGKSTLINRMLGEDRVIVQDQPGTTRDSIFIPFQREGKPYVLIDTAGVRRRARVDEAIEKFSVIKTMQAISSAQVSILVCNAVEGITDQDLHLLGLILEAGTAVIIAMNKWDGLDSYHRERVQAEMARRLDFVEFARRYHISALHGSGIGNLYRAIDEAYAAATRPLPTPQLTEALQQAVADHQPPLSKGRRIRLRYAHLGSQQPLVIVIHGKQTDVLPLSYQRYLANFFRDYFKLVGVPILIRLKNDTNPYKR